METSCPPKRRRLLANSRTESSIRARLVGRVWICFDTVGNYVRKSNRRMTRVGFILFCSTFAAAMQTAAAGADSKALPVFRNTAKEVGYVGSKVCAGCHPQIYRSYGKTAMGKSLTRGTQASETSLGQLPITIRNEELDRYFKVFRQDQDLYQSEYQLRPDGSQVFSTTQKIEYVVGSGVNGFTYWFAGATDFLKLLCPITAARKPGIFHPATRRAITVLAGRFLQLVSLVTAADRSRLPALKACTAIHRSRNLPSDVKTVMAQVNCTLRSARRAPRVSTRSIRR